MARLLFFISLQILFLLALVHSNLAKTIDRKLLGLQRKEKLTHFKVYWHDQTSGPNPTAIIIIPPVKNSTTDFGGVSIIDNPLTAKVSRNSTLVGKAQGFYAGADQKEFAFIAAMNFVFMTGKYNGSTITILGHNPIMSKVREMPIVGGSGLFRFARGYVELRTNWVNLTSADATVEYSCYVLHY